MRCRLAERRAIAVDLGEGEFVVIVNVVVDGERVGRWPIFYYIPGAAGMTREQLAPLVQEKVTQITAALNERSRELMAQLEELGGMGSYELRLDENQDLTWLPKAPDDISELEE